MHKYERIPIRNVCVRCACMVADVAINNLVLLLLCICKWQRQYVPIPYCKPTQKERHRLKAHIAHSSHLACVSSPLFSICDSIFQFLKRSSLWIACSNVHVWLSYWLLLPLLWLLIRRNISFIVNELQHNVMAFDFSALCASLSPFARSFFFA